MKLEGYTLVFLFFVAHKEQRARNTEIPKYRNTAASTKAETPTSQPDSTLVWAMFAPSAAMSAPARSKRRTTVGGEITLIIPYYSRRPRSGEEGVHIIKVRELLAHLDVVQRDRKHLRAVKHGRHVAAESPCCS